MLWNSICRSNVQDYLWFEMCKHINTFKQNRNERINRLKEEMISDGINRRQSSHWLGDLKKVLSAVKQI